MRGRGEEVKRGERWRERKESESEERNGEEDI